MLPIKPINTETDRLFLATRTGLIQCLHESGLPEPIVHHARPNPAELAQAAEAKKKDEGFKAASSAPPSGSAKTTPKKEEESRQRKAINSVARAAARASREAPAEERRTRNRRELSRPSWSVEHVETWWHARE